MFPRRLLRIEEKLRISTQLHFDLLWLCLFRFGHRDSEYAIFGFRRNSALIHLVAELELTIVALQIEFFNQDA